MRLAFHRQMAPRGAHPQDAKFLKADKHSNQHPPVTQSYWHEKFNQKVQPTTTTASKINMHTLSKKPSDTSSHRKQLDPQSQIPSSSDSYNDKPIAPDSHNPDTSSTSTFHTVLRKKNKKHRKTILSPKSYYKKQSHTISTESSNQSVFTKYSEFIDDDTDLSMTASDNDPPPQVSPEKDANMKDASIHSTMTPEEENALLEEFDASTQEPPPKLHKTSSNASNAINSSPQSATPKNHTSHASVQPQAHIVNNDPQTGPTGVNIGMFTSTQEHISTPSSQSLNKAPSIQEQNAVANKIPVSSVLKHIVTCRFKLHIKGSSCNLPHLAKQVVKLFRSADSSLTILPFHGGKDSNTVLDTEENLPHEEEAIKTWVVDSQIIRDRLHFSMRFSCIKDIPFLAKRVFPWMKANRSYVKLDKITSDKISCLGLFEGLHPDFRNRGVFKQYCLQHIKKYNPAIDPEISIFPRSVYAGAGLEKVESRAVVIEVASELAEFVLQAISHPFEGDYEQTTFVPFTKTDSDYSAILRQVMIQQNSMLHSTKRKILHGLKNIEEKFTMKDGTIMSIRDWLLSAQTQDPAASSPLIQYVDITTNNSIAIIFDKTNESIIHTLLGDIHKELLKYFPQDVLTQVYEKTTAPQKTTNTFRVVTDSEKLWADVIKRKYAVNPQSGTDDMLNPPTKNRKVLYHGPSSPPETIQENTFDPAPSESQQSIEQRLNQLEEQAKQNAEKQNVFIQETISKSMESAEAKLILKTNERFSTITNQIADIENKMSVIENLSANVDLLCASLLPPKSTANDAKNTSEGGKNQ